MRAFVLSLVAVVAVGAAFPGGWAVITVDDLPAHFVAGDTVNLSFTVRQHGMDIMADLNPTVVVRMQDDEVSIPARSTGRNGRYVSSFRVRRTGDAEMTIRSGFNKADVRLLPVQAIAATAQPPVVTPVEIGRRLFVAKGCISCHRHAAVTPTNHVGDVGPELTERRYAADYLRRLLEKPDAVLKTTATFRMPDLGLKPHEISALTAFINADR